MDTPNRSRESERRRATILFADISGFTAMSERMKKKCRHRELNGMTTEGFLLRAETLFNEMDLRWDLQELTRVRESRSA